MAPPMPMPKTTEEEPTGTARLGALSGGLLRKCGGLRHSVTAMINMRRMTKAAGGGFLRGPLTSAASNQPRTVPVENTFRLSPDESRRFSPRAVTRLAEMTLELRLRELAYDSVICKELVGELSGLIKERVKQMGYQRYKIVCQVLIGEQREQGMEVATRSLWCADTDNYACATFTNGSLFAIAMVHGAYFE